MSCAHCHIDESWCVPLFEVDGGLLCFCCLFSMSLTVVKFLEASKKNDRHRA